MSAPDIAGVLLGHRPIGGGEDARHREYDQCACGTKHPTYDNGRWPTHRAHVADAIRAELRAWLESSPVQALADQWNETPDYTPSEYDQGRVDQRHDMTTQLLVALAALAEQVGAGVEE